MIVAAPRSLTDALNSAPAARRFIISYGDGGECETVTFGEFRQRSRVQAALLSDRGITAGERVIIIMPQGIPAMTAFAGAMMLGAVPAFLAYPNFKVEPAKYRFGLQGVTTNLSARLVMIDEEFPDDMLEYIALSETSQVVRVGNSAGPSEVEFAEPGINPDSLAFLQHSAGTTGLQKGVALTHGAVLRQVQALAHALMIDGSSDRVYSWLPLYHDMGLIACFMLPLVCHMPVVMQSPLDWVMHPDTMLRAISEHRCTLSWLPNFAFQFVARRRSPEEWSQFDLSSMRAFINCSEPVRAASMDEFYDAFHSNGLSGEAMQSSYAMAENVFAVTQSGISGRTQPARIRASAKTFRAEHRVVPVNEEASDVMTFVSSGSLLPGYEVRIVSESGAVLDPGYVGEILIKSDCLFDGYYNRPDLTQRVLVDGWYHSGDLGFFLEDELYVVGRKKDLLIVGGENIYPQDLEEIASAHPAIHDGRALAMGLYDPDLGTEAVLLVAEVERPELLEDAGTIESEIRSQVVAATGVSIRKIFLKPPKWIVKSTAGKPARSTTQDKLLQEHPELQGERTGL